MNGEVELYSHNTHKIEVCLPENEINPIANTRPEAVLQSLQITQQKSNKSSLQQKAFKMRFTHHF